MIDTTNLDVVEAAAEPCRSALADKLKTTRMKMTEFTQKEVAKKPEYLLSLCLIGRLV